MHVELSKVNTMTLSRDGALRSRSAVSAATLHGIESAVACLPPGGAGTRLYGVTALRPLLAPTGSVGAVAARVLGDVGVDRL